MKITFLIYNIISVTVVTKKEMVMVVVIAVQMVKTKLVEETTRTYLQRQSPPPKSRPLLQARREPNSGKCLQLWRVEEPLLHEQLQVRTPLASPRCLSSSEVEQTFSQVQPTRPCAFLCASSSAPASPRSSIVDT